MTLGEKKSEGMASGSARHSHHGNRGPKSYLAIFLSMAIFLLGASLPTSANPTLAGNNLQTNVSGVVIDKRNLIPVQGAIILLAELNLSTISDQNGEFTFTKIELAEPILYTNLLIQAQGYGDWQMIGIALVAGDTLLIDAELANTATTIEIPELGIRDKPDPDVTKSFPEFQGPAFVPSSTLPDTIRVRVTGQVATCDTSLPYTVEVIDFKDYVKHVLPNEWVRTWPRESLRAGAMAAKMYAWEITAAGGRWSDANVYDSVCDQVYIPGVTYGSTNNAVDFTWAWRLTHTDGHLFRTHYLDWFWRCEDFGWQGTCMGQWDTYFHSLGNQGYEKITWDEMLDQYYWDSSLSYIPTLPPAGFALRFFGNGWGDFDRLKILIDDPVNGDMAADVGSTDFTLEWWMKVQGGDNNSPTCIPGGEGWMAGNIIFDRDVSGQGDYGEYGVSLTGSTIAFGVNNGVDSVTLCGTLAVVDGKWHHVALTRSLSDGVLRIFIDGVLDAEAVGPGGDISYRDGRTSSDPDQDPYLVIGARKSDSGLAYNGYLDEIRISNSIRYSTTFQPFLAPFESDENSVGIYHLDEGFGNAISDNSASLSGPSDAFRLYGGDPSNGPEWEVSTLFLIHQIFIPILIQ